MKNKKIQKKDAAQKIVEVKSALKDAYPHLSRIIEDVTIYILPNDKALNGRNQIAREIGADEKATVADTAAEVLVGKERFVILLYYARINENIFCHYLFHEFGHVVSISHCRTLFKKVQEDIASDLDTELRNGAALWSELVAETFAYRAEHNRFSPYPGYAALQAEKLMDEAVNDDVFMPYPFAFYLAMFFEDPEILYYRDRYPNVAVGANHCDDEIMPIIEKTLNVVVRLLDKDDFWIITEDELKQVGKRVNELWDYCWHKRNVKLLDNLYQLLN